MKKKLLNSIYSAWLGFSLIAFAGVSPRDVGFWIVIIPTVILVEIFNSKEQYD